MNLVLKYLPWIIVVDCRGHKNRVTVSGTVRYFAVRFPCLLISFQVLGADERPKIFNRGGVIYKCLPQECVSVGRLMGGAVPSGFIEEGECRSESGPQVGTGSDASGVLLAPQLKSVIGKDGEQDANKGDEGDNHWSLYDWLLNTYAIVMMY